MFKIGVLASGGGTNLQAVIDAVKSGIIKGEIVSVLSNNKSAYALERARVNGIEAVNIGRKQFSGISEYSKALASFFRKRNRFNCTCRFYGYFRRRFYKAFQK